MTGNEYQHLASRTIGSNMNAIKQEKHALHGMVGEIGELHSLYQKKYQGHDFDEEHAKKELGDLLWFVAEYCTAWGWALEDVMQLENMSTKYWALYAENKALKETKPAGEGES